MLIPGAVLVEKVNSIFNLCREFKQVEIVSGEFREVFACDSVNPFHLLLPITESVKGRANISSVLGDKQKRVIRVMQTQLLLSE